MIIVRTPLRISLGGGGTDLPSFYSKFGSMFVSAAINKYVYITLHRSLFSKKIRCRYSVMEEVDTVEEIKNEIIKESLKKYNVLDCIELTSHAEIPSGTGLGSSGSFGVGIAHALKILNGLDPQKLVKEELAEDATDIQMNILGYPIGKQDQYAAAFGGVNSYTIDKMGNVKVFPIDAKERLKELESRLALFFTGYNRDANKILAYQKEKTEQSNCDMVSSLSEIQKFGYAIKNVLEFENLDRIGELMNLHWQQKKKRFRGMSNEIIDYWYDVGMRNGALGGKLVGAGGGGFLLFYTHNVYQLTKAIELPHIPFKFEFEGSKVLLHD